MPQYPFAECFLHTVPRIFFYGTDPQCGQETLTKKMWLVLCFCESDYFATLLAKKYIRILKCSPLYVTLLMEIME